MGRVEFIISVTALYFCFGASIGMATLAVCNVAFPLGSFVKENSAMIAGVPVFVATAVGFIWACIEEFSQ